MNNQENAQFKVIREQYFLTSKNGLNLEIYESQEMTDNFKVKVCVPYLKHLYDELLKNSDDKQKGINKTSFMTHFSLSGLVGDKFFDMFDNLKSGYVQPVLFIGNLLKMYSKNFNVRLKFIFELLDFKLNGEAQIDDIKAFLMFIPIELEQKGYSKNPTLNTIEYMDLEIKKAKVDEMINYSFKGRDKINFEEFKEVNENVSSDVFFCIYLYIKKFLPCYYDFNQFCISQNIINECQTPKSKVKTLASPKIINRYSSNLALKNDASPKEELKVPSSKSTTSTSLEVMQGGTKQFNIKLNFAPLNLEENTEDRKIPDEFELDPITPAQKKGNYKYYNTDVCITPCNYNHNLNNEGLIFCSCGQKVDDINDPICSNCKLMEKDSKCSGIIRKYSNKRKQYEERMIVISKNLITISQSTKPEQKKSFLLSSNSYLEEKEQSDSKLGEEAFVFTIMIGNKKIICQPQNKEEYERWIKVLRNILKYSLITDCYILEGVITKISFGEIIKGIHKKSGKEVAIKVYNKEKMEKNDIERIYQEIEIMRECLHPNIIRLFDFYESKKKIYLIIEYLKGGDLFTYLENREFSISEKRANQIIYKIIIAIKYIHSLGIVHRDLKPENILMTDDSDEAEPKLSDFGFSKILRPHEKLKDRLGTILYASPEVIKGLPYGKEADIWSLGMVCHLLLVGYLYFDDDDKQTIMNRIVEEEVQYPHFYWLNVSDSAINLLKGCFKQDAKKRFNIDQILDHPWIKKAIKSRESNSPNNIFRNGNGNISGFSEALDKLISEI